MFADAGQCSEGAGLFKQSDLDDLFDLLAWYRAVPETAIQEWRNANKSFFDLNTPALTEDEYIEKFNPVLATRDAEKKMQFAQNLDIALEWLLQYTLTHRKDLADYCKQSSTHRVKRLPTLRKLPVSE